MSIKIYTTPTCTYCIQAKNYFEGKNIDYEEIDVSKDQKAAQEMIKISGQMGVPVILINDQTVVGFDKDKIESILKA
ncbi:MAG TPA: glutaredoxin family protein [Patescibacteria group bacterium]|nr:glutaredoxin family protein [Patescibacteria group bacterium]